jgi:hypothetical protein
LKHQLAIFLLIAANAAQEKEKVLLPASVSKSAAHAVYIEKKKLQTFCFHQVLSKTCS